MHRMIFLLAAVGFLVGSLSWVAGARRAYRRAVAVEHRGLEAAQWRSLAAKDGLAGALLLSLVPVMVAEAVQGRTVAADWFLLLAVAPLLGSLSWVRRFIRLAGLIEAEADYAQRQREGTRQQASWPATWPRAWPLGMWRHPAGRCCGRCSIRPRVWSAATSWGPPPPARLCCLPSVTSPATVWRPRSPPYA
jgi:hypothetical protein